jgi:hypothetical protein
MKTVVLGCDCQWHEITHEKAQDIIYQAGGRRASIEIKRMIHYSEAHVLVGNVLLKLQEMPNEIN